MEIASPMPRVPPVTTATRAISSSLCSRLPCLSIFSTSFFRKLARLELPLDAHGDAHAAADAERRQPLLGIAPGHLVEERDQHPRARGPDGMTERDRAAVHVDLARIPAEFLVDRAGLGGE